MGEKCDLTEGILTFTDESGQLAKLSFEAAYWERELERIPPQYLFSERISFIISKKDEQFFKLDDRVRMSFPMHDIDKPFFIIKKIKTLSGNFFIVIAPAYVNEENGKYKGGEEFMPESIAANWSIIWPVTVKCKDFERFISAIGKVNATEFKGSPAGSIIIESVTPSIYFGIDTSDKVLLVTISFEKIQQMHFYLGEDGKCKCGKSQCVYDEVDFNDLLFGT